MPRPSENRKIVSANPRVELREKIGKKIIDMGYVHFRDGAALPAWTEFLEAIAEEKIILYKKVE